MIIDDWFYIEISIFLKVTTTTKSITIGKKGARTAGLSHAEKRDTTPIRRIVGNTTDALIGEMVVL